MCHIHTRLIMLAAVLLVDILQLSFMINKTMTNLSYSEVGNALSIYCTKILLFPVFHRAILFCQFGVC